MKKLRNNILSNTLNLSLQTLDFKLQTSNTKLIFKVEVFHNEETIGAGSHIRYIVDKDDF